MAHSPPSESSTTSLLSGLLTLGQLWFKMWNKPLLGWIVTGSAVCVFVAGILCGTCSGDNRSSPDSPRLALLRWCFVGDGVQDCSVLMVWAVQQCLKNVCIFHLEPLSLSRLRGGSAEFCGCCHCLLWTQVRALLFPLCDFLPLHLLQAESFGI